MSCQLSQKSIEYIGCKKYNICVGRIVAITGDCKSPAHRAPLVRVQPGAQFKIAPNRVHILFVRKGVNELLHLRLDSKLGAIFFQQKK